MAIFNDEIEPFIRVNSKQIQMCCPGRFKLPSKN